MNSVLLGIAFKSIVVLSAAWVAALVARRSSAAARHLIWTAAAVALLALPLLTVSLPTIHFAPADRVLASAVTFTSGATAAPYPSSPVAPLRAVTHSARPGRSSRDCGLILAIVWAGGAVFAIARILLGWLAMQRLRRRSLVAPSDELNRLAGQIGIRGRLELLETPAGTMPMTCGWMRPAIFLPSDAAEWSAEKRRAVLLHELAHVRRGDVATQFLARMALSLYWWNPLGWLAWREFLKMRERATDDLVLDAGTRASEYAGHLLEVARSTVAAPAMAAIAMAQRSQLETRLAAILDSRIRRKNPGRIAIAFAAIAPVLIIAPVAAVRAQNQSALTADVDATIRAATGQKNFEMLDRAAEGFIKIRQYQTAEQLLEAALAIRSHAAGQPSDAYSEGLVKLGNLAWEHGRGLRGKAQDYYQQAISSGDRPGTAPALLRLGILSFRDPATAENYLQRSMTVDPSGKSIGPAMAWMAVVRNEQGNAAEAESLFLRSQSAVKSGSMDEALALEMYASFLAGHQRDDEAQPLRLRADKLRAEHVASLSPKAVDAGNPRVIGGTVSPPTVQSKIEPEYSPEARALKLQGTATLKMVIGTDGKAGNVALAGSLGYGLDEKALDAISQWRFNPGTETGTPVPVIATIEINFRLL